MKIKKHKKNYKVTFEGETPTVNLFFMLVQVLLLFIWTYLQNIIFFLSVTHVFHIAHQLQN